MKNIVHMGFDGLDVAFETHIPADFAANLSGLKEIAAATREPQLFERGGAKMHVADSGGLGGYTYRVDTGPDGATWFFKQPGINKDPWGVKVSVKSLALALYGLGGVRAKLFAFMEAVGIPYHEGAESISRVDYCLDFFDPDFVLDPSGFVMHSNCSRTENHDMETYGRSGRLTGVRIGKMPGRQVAIYDKRADVIAKKKKEWWEIWNANRREAGLPLLSPDNRATSQVWRIELRAGKKLLKEKWNIRKWEDLDDKLGDLIQWTLRSIRYCVPTTDQNRARWPNTQLWDDIARELQSDLFEMACNASPALVKEVIRSEHAELLKGQLVGLTVSYLSMLDIDHSDLGKVGHEIKKLINHSLLTDPDLFEEKIDKARKRYAFISP
ncbi:MAG: hypothetical protein JJ879_14160 [Sneathiella sp.]|nr:hypothetical protein [Sneathiella sp.]